MRVIKELGLLFCFFYFVFSEQNGTQTAYQSSTLSEYGYVYKAELALDQDNLTYSATVASLSDPAWFTLDLGRPYQSGRLHMNLKVIDNGETEEIEEIVEIQEAYVVLMNDFHAHSNPPNASIHHVCWKTGELKSFNSFIKSKSCFTETNVPFRYVAVLVPERFQLKVHSIEFNEEIKNIALQKLTKSNIQSVSYNPSNTELAVDDEEDTCSSELKWLLVDLGRPYMITGVKFTFTKSPPSYTNIGRFSVLTMNDFDEYLNPPNTLIHNICWEPTYLQERVNYINYQWNVSCVTTIPYQYVVLYYHHSTMSVCDLKVYEVCSVGSFGANCSRSCHCQAGSACHWDSGKCETGCEVGWHGEACDLKDDEREDEFVHLTWSLNGNISIRSSELKKGKHIFLKNRVPLQDWIQIEEIEE